MNPNNSAADSETGKQKRLTAAGIYLALLYFGLMLIWWVLTRSISYIYAFAVGGLLLFPLWRCLRDLPEEERLLVLIAFAGFVLKACYVLYTPISIRQHDVHSFIEDENGHSAYIRYLFDYGMLPQFDPRTVFQFYHPPLHHILAAAWARFNLIIGIPLQQCWRNIQLLTLLYMSLGELVFAKILQELHFHGKALLFPFLLFCFHPYFIFLSGSINNDPLSVLFMLLVVLYTLRWSNEPSMKNSILLALWFGLGMSVKLSVAYLAPGTAMVFLHRLFTEKDWAKRYLKQWIVFAVIVFPLGLWWYVRNAVRFGVPLTYVPLLSENSSQYLGDQNTFWDRLIRFDFSELRYLYVSYGHNGADYLEHNILLAALKSSVFEEQTLTGYYEGVRPASVLLFLSNLLLAICSVPGMLLGFKKQKKEHMIFFTISYALIMLLFISFCFSYPHVCSQIFRYIIPTLFCGLIGLGNLFQLKNTQWLEWLCCSFVLFSILQFLLLGV